LPPDESAFVTTAPEVEFDLPRVGAAFSLPGEFRVAERWGSGHINDTFRATWESGATVRRYIHQRINDHVFPDPVAVMRNVAAVTRHVRARLTAQGVDDLDRRVLTLVPTRDGHDFHRDDEGHLWRTYLFVERSRSVDVMEHAAQAFAAGRAFGEFQVLLSDFAGPRLLETIRGFHDTPRRFSNFVRALEADLHGRAAACRVEATALLAAEAQTRVLQSLLEQGLMPERIVHNDTKLNNLLLDERTGEPLCVIDLDTVMPGLSLHDFGDLVRTGAARAAEDEPDLSKVGVDVALYEGIVRGYLSTAGPFLTAAEKQNLAAGAETIVLENALRFLTDHLEGDMYFRVHRPGHNLDRCRTQLAFFHALEARGDLLRRRIEVLAEESGDAGRAEA
jgi:Ser/Thr protein kinase RdoA (MazF antagonist)